MIKKNFAFIAILLFVFSLSSVSCKDNIEDTIDCLSDGFLISASHTADAQDAKKITFKVTYSGDHKLDSSVKWDFGDGKTETGGTEVTHTYSSTGTFTVKAMDITVRNGEAWCSHEKDLTVTIN